MPVRPVADSRWTLVLILTLLATFFWPFPADAAGLDPGPPDGPVKLVFIHHSTGEAWLADDNGGLARALQQNNYFVSDTNYGWGPDAIGDRTDIENWPEWFTGPPSGRYLEALYREGGVNSPYTRTLADPGGENRIILFKSCFPNSELEGKPHDPPRRGDGLTVANAKAIYLELLTYFAARPDKLFIVITAPPVQNSAHAQNARAFNTWLAQEWLKGHQGRNVAVFDFYNILTGKDNHHRFQNGRIEYVTDRGRNTSAYPTDSGDDHPNPAGNKKATAEFVPLLNVFYHLWAATAPAAVPTAPTPPAAAPAPPTPPAAAPGDLLEDFESDAREWQVFLDEQKGTKLTGQRDPSRARSGKYSLKIDYQVALGWATYSLVYPSPQDWRSKAGLSLYLHAEKPDTLVTITVYNGEAPDALKHFEYQTEAGAEAVQGWRRLEITWDRFVQPPWEGDGSVRFDPGRSYGLAFVFGAGEPAIKGRLWVDQVEFLPGK
ncbi:MAG: hypothetical protein AB1896_16525 [Thermodesulfobacteriota bacterium]